MNTLSIAAADLRASFKRELERLSARPLEGGPSCAVRNGVLLAWVGDGPEVVVDEDLVFVLARLPDGAGPDAVMGVLGL